ncbi:hypothetical protein XmelCFBP4644_20125 [Xanthomonas melonis]|uniref:Mechanosensitive ion channel MscS domain-containing protein n=2 Tax=Xanthomonas melonis TaxID=56456 RepID=A0A2S7D9K0_9XANT|nr:hypothetical protein XmelCFBP4644_20125 [Xanthomonas melonis]
MIHARSGLVARSRVLLISAMFLLPALSGTVSAVEPPPSDQWSAAVEALESRTATVEGVSASDSESRDAKLAGLRALADEANSLGGMLERPIAQAKERVAQLGDSPSGSLDPAIKAQADKLEGELTTLEDLKKRVSLVALSAEQELTTAAQAQAAALGQELFSRSASPFSRELWQPALENAPAVLSPSPSGLVHQESSTSSLNGTAATILWAGLVGLVWAGAALLLRLARAWALRSEVATRPFANAMSATALLALFMAPSLQAYGSLEPLLSQWGLSLPYQAIWMAIATGLLLTILVAGLARAVLQPRNPELALFSMQARTSKRGWAASVWIGAAMGIGIGCEQLVARLALQDDLALPLQALGAFCSVSLVLVALLLLRRIRLRPPSTDGNEDALDPVALVIGAAWLACLVILFSGTFGYIVLANWIAQWLIWGAVVGASALFVMTLVDRSVRYILEVKRPQRRGEQSPSRRVRQFSVILSAALRTTVVLLACGALFMPFGAGFTSVLELTGKLAAGVQIGEIRISAASVLTGLLVFAGVAFLLRVFRGWLENTYLPTTRLAQDARDSITTIVGYLGTAAAVLWALAAVGVGVDKLAILASALSVGIGFGLQAITQNFVSGLILLVERPIKLGDRIKIGDAEGTVRKVSVRSTVIRLVDQSTVIVPNSELITKPVQNLSQQFSRPKLELTVAVDVTENLQDTLDMVARELSDNRLALTIPAPIVELISVDEHKAVLRCQMHLKPQSNAADQRVQLILAIRQRLGQDNIKCAIS